MVLKYRKNWAVRERTVRRTLLNELRKLVFHGKQQVDPCGDFANFGFRACADIQTNSPEGLLGTDGGSLICL